MVAKILESFPSMDRALDYNEAKVTQAVASVIGVSGIDGDSLNDIRKTFESYEHRNISTWKVSFHMALCPGAGEEMSDQNAFSLARDMMESLGYGGQPFVVFKHEDIERVHYHVVSIRVDGKGKKINDYYENQHCYQALQKYAEKYGYIPGTLEDAERDVEILRFNPKRGDVINQVRTIFDECLTYRFTSYEQFEAILWAHGVKLDFRTGASTQLYVQGLGPDGKTCTKKISEKAAATAFYQLYSERALECAPLMGVMSRERERICNCARWPLENVSSYGAFRKVLAGKDIYVHMDRDPDNHKFTGGFFVDHHNKCAFDLEDMGDALTLEQLQEADEKRWSAGQESGVDITLGDFLAGLSSGHSKSHEKDIKDDPRKKRKKQRRI